MLKLGDKVRLQAQGKTLGGHWEMCSQHGVSVCDASITHTQLPSPELSGLWQTRCRALSPMLLRESWP